MSIKSNLLNFQFVLLILILIAQSEAQQVFRKSDGDSQQVQAKVERINLKDFGFERRTPTQSRTYNKTERYDRDDRNRRIRPQISIESRFLSPYEDNTNWRNSRRSYSSSGRSYSRRDLQEPPKSSPLDWTASSSGVALVNTQNEMTPKRAFDFTSNLTSSDRLSSQRNVQKRNCSELCVDQKYLQHYRAKGCSPLMDYECNCAISFRCETEQAKNSTVCRYEGRVYQIGSRIPVRNPCRICECRDFGRGRGPPLAQIDCGVSIECPESVFGLKPEPNCYFGYKHNQCCGQQVCDTSLTPKREQKVCNYKNRQYKVGQKIYPDEDPCKMCLCSHDWDDNNFLNSSVCQTYSCDFQLDKDFLNGCLPIYHEGTCCPIEYKCPKTSRITDQKFDQNQCQFDGRLYPIGSRLKAENVCVDCQCKTPPDFTCVHKSCPTPPGNCYVGVWDHSVCCQTYTCSRPDQRRDNIRDESQFRHNFYSNPNN